MGGKRRIGSCVWDIGMMLEAWVQHGGKARTEFFLRLPSVTSVPLW